MPINDNRQIVHSVERCMDILHFIATAGEPKGVSQLSRELGFSKSAAHRLCQTLMRGRFLVQDPGTGEYRPGGRLFQITRCLLEQLSFAEASRAAVAEMAKVGRQSAFAASATETGELLVCQEVRVDNPVQPRSLLGLRAGLLDAPGGLLCLATLPAEQIEPALKEALHYPGLKRRHSYQQACSAVQALLGQESILQLDMPEASLAVVCSVVQIPHGRPAGVLGYCYPMLQRDHVDSDSLRRHCSCAARHLSGATGA